jgi:hypothetical protein
VRSGRLHNFRGGKFVQDPFSQGSIAIVGNLSLPDAFPEAVGQLVRTVAGNCQESGEAIASQGIRKNGGRLAFPFRRSCPAVNGIWLFIL